MQHAMRESFIESISKQSELILEFFFHVWFSVCSLRLFLCHAYVFMCLCVCVDSDLITQCEVCQYLWPLLWLNSIIHGIWVPIYMICSRKFWLCKIILVYLWSVSGESMPVYTWKAEVWPLVSSDPQRSSKIFWFY